MRRTRLRMSARSRQPESSVGLMIAPRGRVATMRGRIEENNGLNCSRDRPASDHPVRVATVSFNRTNERPGVANQPMGDRRLLRHGRDFVGRPTCIYRDCHHLMRRDLLPVTLLAVFVFTATEADDQMNRGRGPSFLRFGDSIIATLQRRQEYSGPTGLALKIGMQSPYRGRRKS